MKSILIAGAALMVGASIYGFVDYKKNHNKNEFKKMYVETPAETDMTGTTTETLPEKAVETKKETAATAETKTAVNNKASKNTTAKKKVAAKKKKRAFSTKLFSRGALDERYIKPIEKEEIKTDTKKTEEKEQ